MTIHSFEDLLTIDEELASLFLRPDEAVNWIYAAENSIKNWIDNHNKQYWEIVRYVSEQRGILGKLKKDRKTVWLKREDFARVLLKFCPNAFEKGKTVSALKSSMEHYEFATELKNLDNLLSGHIVRHHIKEVEDLLDNKPLVEPNKEVTNHCWKFWQDETVVAEYITEAHENFGFSHGGGLNQGIKEELSNEQRGNLYNGYLVAVFKSVKNHIEQDLWEEADKQMEEYTKQVNKICMLSFRDTGAKDDKSEYADCIVRFKNIPKEVKDPELWQVKLRENGTGAINFRVYAMHDAGLKPEMEVVNTKGEVVLEFDLHDLRAGYTRDTGENFIDLNDYDISGGDFEDKCEITFEPSFKHVVYTERAWYEGDDYMDWVVHPSQDADYQARGIYFEDWTDGIIDVMKAHKYVKPNTNGEISDNSMGLQMTGTFDPETRQGSGTWKLDWNFYKEVLTEQQVKTIFSTWNALYNWLCDEYDRKHEDWNLLIDGTMQNNVEGTFTVRLIDGEYVYQFTGTGTYKFDAKAFNQIVNATWYTDFAHGISTLHIPLKAGVEKNQVFTTDVTVEGKVQVTYQFMVTK